MADERTYSIMDEHGIEHEFPSGFDPIQAARIVRQNSKKDSGLLSKFVDWAVEPSRPGIYAQTEMGKTANMIDTTERTPVHARVTDVLKDAGGIASDVASGLVHHPIDTLRGAAAGVTQGVGDVLAGYSSPAAIASLAAGPAGKLAKGVPALANAIRIAGGGANAVMGAKGAEDVIEAPDAEGKILGGTQALLGLHGTVSDPAVQAGLRKTAVSAGEMLQKAASKPGFVRATAIGGMAGAAGAGHPILAASGLPLMVLPEAMGAAGRALTRFGTGTTGVQPTAAATGAEPLARGATTRTPIGVPIVETPIEAAKRLQAQKPTSTGVAPDLQVNSTAEYLTNLSKMAPEAQRAELAARTAAHKGGAGIPVDVPEVAPEGAPADVPADLPTSGRMEDALANQPRLIDQLPARGPNTAPAGFNGGNFGSDAAAGRNLFGDEIPDTVTPQGGFPRTAGPDPRIAAIGEDAGASPAAREILANRESSPTDLSDVQGKMFEALMGRETGLPDFTFEGQENYDPSNPPAGPAVGEMAPEPDSGLPADAEVSGDAAYDPSQPPPGPSISMTEPNVVSDNDPRVAGPAPASAFADQLAAAEAPLPAPAEVLGAQKPRVRVKASGEVSKGVYTDPETGETMHPIETVFPASRSRRSKSQMSATKGMTKADMTAMGLDPSKAYTHVTQAQAEAGKAARAARTQKYYQAALEEKAQAEAGM